MQNVHEGFTKEQRRGRGVGLPKTEPKQILTLRETLTRSLLLTYHCVPFLTFCVNELQKYNFISIFLRL